MGSERPAVSRQGHGQVREQAGGKRVRPDHHRPRAAGPAGARLGGSGTPGPMQRPLRLSCLLPPTGEPATPWAAGFHSGPCGQHRMGEGRVSRATRKRPHSLQTLGGPRAGRAQWVSPPGQASHWPCPSSPRLLGAQAHLAQALPQRAGGLPRQSCEGRKRLKLRPATRPAVVLGAGGRGMGGQGVYLSSLLNWGWASAISRLLLNIALLQQEQSEKTELLTQPHQAAREAGPPHSSTRAGHGPPGPRPGTRARGEVRQESAGATAHPTPVTCWAGAGGRGRPWRMPSTHHQP